MPPFPPDDFSQYTAADFVLNESFRQWVLQPTEASMSFWHTFMLRHPDRQPVLDEASAILLHLRARYDDLGTASRDRIWQLLDTARDTASTNGPAPARFRFGRVGGGWPAASWRVAASVAGLLLLAGGGWWHYRTGRAEVHTGFGEVRVVTLPDGSVVRLNANSTLTFPRYWQTQADREVWLDGEAFFRVTKIQGPGHRLRFVTHTPNVDIAVLGTRFNVNTRRGNTLVVLAEGRISLSRPNAPASPVLPMKPGDMATVQAGIEQVGIRPARPRVQLAWVRQQFAFENTPLRDIAQQLADTQGLTLIFEDNALADRRFTGNLSSQDVATLLTTLEATFDLRAERDGSRVYLRHEVVINH